MPMKLFDDVGDDDNEEIEKIEINPEFAKRYEHNKKREDLQKYEEMKKKGLIDSETESDSESDSDDIDVTKDFFDGILKIRKKDPILLKKDVNLFGGNEDSDDDKKEKKKKKKEKKAKPIYMKDLNASQLIRDGAELFDEEEEEEEEEEIENEKMKMKSFVEEQEELRRETLKAMAAEEARIGDDDDEQELLREKKRGGVEEEGEDDEEIKQKLDEYFGEDEKLSEGDRFLKEFFREKMWIDKGKGNGNVGGGEEVVGLSEDEEEIVKQEEYERGYNFRHEEDGSDRVLGHSRVVDDSVRKVKNSRRDQRIRKREREELAEIQRQEEVKRLKNLKRKELLDKLREVAKIAGFGQDDVPLDEDDFEKDYDPLEYDTKMRAAFGDKYYEAEDVDPTFGDADLEKPDFGKEDELLGLPKDWDVIKSKDGFWSKREEDKKKKKGGVEVGDEEMLEEDEEEEEEEEGEELEEGKRKKKRKSKLGEALRKELEEELYKYDYEDAIGDLKTRFKYRQVKPDRYKLSAAEILWLDEQELNQYVSLKKLATYREQEWKVAPMRKKMLLEGALNEQLKPKKRKMDGGEGSSKMGEVAKPQEEEGNNNEEVKLSRSARRRKNRKEKALPKSRLNAYGITSGSKK
ncbi:hypothetical protein vseg_009683 [Gypsophila vaccaria]